MASSAGTSESSWRSALSNWSRHGLGQFRRKVESRDFCANFLTEMRSFHPEHLCIVFGCSVIQLAR